jgi:hypothetical protein
MKEKRFLKCFGGIDEKYVEEAAPAGRSVKKMRLAGWGVAAACFVMVAALCAGILKLRNNDDVAVLENGEMITFVKSDMVACSLALDMDVKSRELTDEELDRLFPNMPVTAYAHFDADQNLLFGLEGKIGNIKLVVSMSDFQILDTIIEGNEESSIVNGIPVTAGYFVTKPNSKGEKTVIYYAFFELGNSRIYVENAGAEDESEIVKNELADMIEMLISNGELEQLQF